MDGEQKIQKAYQSILQHDFEKAIEWFEQAVKEHPDNADFRYKLSITYARSNKLNQAIDHAEKAFQLDPESEKYKLHLEHLQSRNYMKEAEKVLNNKQQLHHAASMLSKAVSLDPLAIEAYMLLGSVKIELAEFKEAVEAFREALKLDPQNDQATQLLQLCKQKLKKQLEPPN